MFAKALVFLFSGVVCRIKCLVPNFISSHSFLNLHSFFYIFSVWAVPIGRRLESRFYKCLSHLDVFWCQHQLI